MTHPKRLILFALLLWIGVAVFSGAVWPFGRGRADGVFRTGPLHSGVRLSADSPPPPPSPHPLEPALQLARTCLANIETNIQDYSATVTKREQVDGKVTDPEEMFIKVRHQPFSVHLFFEIPASLKGQEVVYVQGKNGGNLLALPAGLKRLLGTFSLPPEGLIAMHGQRYPITEIGILNLTRRLIEAAEQGLKYGECEVTISKEQFAGRACTCIDVMHPVPRQVFRFYKARVCIDERLNIPVHYEAHDWPSTPGGEAPLLEEYTYRDVKLNNGFTDADFQLP